MWLIVSYVSPHSRHLLICCVLSILALIIVVIIIIIIIMSLKIFHSRLSWWSSTGVGVTASLLMSPGLFSVFWLTLLMQSFEWSPLNRHLSHYFPDFPSLYQCFGDPHKFTNYNWYHWHYYVPYIFHVLQQGLGTYLSFHFLLILPCRVSG